MNPGKSLFHGLNFFTDCRLTLHFYSVPLLLLLSRFSRVRLCVTPQTAAHQAPPSLEFSRQEHWSWRPFPSPMHESEKWKGSRSVVSDSSRPHGPQPTRLLYSLQCSSPSPPVTQLLKNGHRIVSPKKTLGFALLKIQL